MLQMNPRARIPATRFPPIPSFTRSPRPLSRADQRIIRSALAGGDVSLPTDWPDMSALLDLLAEPDRPLPEGILRRRENAA